MNDVVVWEQQFSHRSAGRVQNCGEFSDEFENVHIEQIVNGSTMKVKITTTLDQDPADEAFGIADFRINTQCPGNML